MKKLSINRRKLNNSGMTLIEVLVALTLLTVAIMPMLSSFVQVSKFSEKGRMLQQTTTIAQTAMENCKAYNVDAIHSQMTASTPTFLSGSYLTGADWSYVTNGDTNTYFINNMNVDNRKVGMSIKLTPLSSTEKSLTKYENVNEYLDAVFVASTTKNDTLDPADQKTFVQLEEEFFNGVLDDLATEITNIMNNDYVDELAGHSVSRDELRDQYFDQVLGSSNENGLKVSRKITITASTDIATGVDKAIVTYSYKVDGINDYAYEFDGTDYSFPLSTSSVNGRTASYTATIYSNAISKDYAGNLERIYCYYYPTYNEYTQDSFRCTSDDIIVDTTDLKYFASGVWNDKSIDVYLIKQLTSSETDVTLKEAEKYYHTGTVTTKCGNSATINLFHNYKTNIGEPDGDELTWALGNGLTVATGNCVDVGALTKTETKKLMYEIQIKLYSNPELNSGVMSGEEILTLEGTKINW